MKRVTLFSLVFLLVFMSSASFAAVQNFTRFSCEVPEGWTPSENEKGSVVGFTQDADPSNIVMVEILENTLTLEETAKDACQSSGGTGLAMFNEMYTFQFQYKSVYFKSFLWEKQTDPKFPEGVYCLFSTNMPIYEVNIGGGKTLMMNESVRTIMDSITINQSWVNGNDENDSPKNPNNNDEGNDTGTEENKTLGSSGGGGCNSGIISLAWVVFGFGFFRKK